MTPDQNPYRAPGVALEPQGPEVPRYRSGGPLAASTVVLLYLTIPTEAAAGVLALLWPETPLFDEASRALVLILVLSAVVALVSVALNIACAVLFCVWFHRAYRNLLALGQSPRLAAGWAPGSFFVPILNLFRPYQIAREIWQKSGESADLGPVPAWWALFLTSSAVGLVGGRLEHLHPLGRVLVAAGALLSVLAALVTVQMIRGVARRQDRRFQRAVAELRR